jgi:hypothetical protein
VAMMQERDIRVSHTTIHYLGNSLRAGVREAVEPLRTIRKYVQAR